MFETVKHAVNCIGNCWKPMLQGKGFKPLFYDKSTNRAARCHHSVLYITFDVNGFVGPYLGTLANLIRLCT